MILHTKEGKKLRGRFVEKCRNCVVIEHEHEGPKAVSVESLRSVEVQHFDRAGKNERGKPVKVKDAGDLRWPRPGY